MGVGGQQFLTNNFGKATPKQRTAAVIAAHNDRALIGSTVRAAIAIPTVDLIVVVDDGSDDDTAQVARGAGAATVRHSVQRGRSSALETGVKVAAMRDRADWPARNILFLDANLGDSAVEGGALVEAVTRREADCATAVMPLLPSNFETINQRAWHFVKAVTGWDCLVPLATQRCITREALNAVMPFRSGWSVDLGMTMELIVKGYSIVEIPCAFQYRRKAQTTKGHKISRFASQYRDIVMTGLWYRLFRQKVPTRQRIPLSEQRIGVPYQRLDAIEVRKAARN